MIDLETELRASLRTMMLGTGPLPEAEPWRRYAKACRMLGRDVTAISGPLWNVVYAGKDVMSDAAALERTMVVRAGGIALLMIGCRLVLNQVRGDTSMLPRYIDLLGFLAAAVMTGCVLWTAIRSIPRSWLWNGRFSPEFFSWFEMLVLDDSKTIETGLREIIDADHQRVRLRALELRDGMARDEERRLIVLEAAGALNRKDRVGLARFAGTLPVLDLLIAGLLAIGLCGVPFVEWLMQSGISRN